MKASQGYRCASLKHLIEQAKHDKVAAYNAALLLAQEHCGAFVSQQYFLRSALLGYAPAMLTLAGRLVQDKYLQRDDSYEDVVTVRDTALAVGWIKQAAKIGDSTAVYALARCCLEGLAMKQSTTNCRYYLNQIPFPNSGLNLYKVSEAQIFGSLSAEIRKFIFKRTFKEAVAEHR